MDSPLLVSPPISASELRHRLRTPLNHVIGYSEFLIEEYPGAPCTEQLREILGEANAILESIQQMTAGDRATVPPDVLNALGNRLGAGAGRIRGMVLELEALMPPAAMGDLRRMALAARSLPEALTVENAGHSDAKLQAPPALAEADKPVESRLEASAGPGRILVVDDDEINRDMLCRQLSRQQLEVVTAPDGATAIGMLRAQRFDILLLDLMMPGMDGFEVLKAVKGDPALFGVAVIMVSALDEMDSMARSIEAGAEDYLFKPVNPTLLRARIKSTLEKLRAEEAVRRKQRLESIGLLAAGIAHDFNNLLTGIIGYSQLLRQVLTAPADREMVDAILRGGERAAELTRQLLAYSGKGVLRMQTVNLASLIRESEGLIHASLPAEVRLQLQLGPAPPVIADVNQLRRVLLNLTLNAAEAIGPDSAGLVSIETGTEEVAAGAQFDVIPDELQPGLYAWVEVRDSGCGMDTATRSKIFEPFFTTKFLGRGLGLAAVAGIVRSHKGLLRVSGAPGQGTALRLYFPVAAEEEMGALAGEKHGAGAIAPVTLVVEAESEVRQIVKVTLERTGRGVVLADSAKEAMEALQRLRDRIDSVLLDCNTALMDGSEVLARLRELCPAVKVIISSGLVHSEAEERFQAAGAAGYLQKPYRMSELLSLLEKASPGGDFTKLV
jgi:CheY-like chemotaxis protein